jgi:putative spermidine/putrescine transport system ATP-binding protein
MVFQNYALFPNLSVAENIAYGLRVRREEVTRRSQRVAEMMAMVHMTEFADRPIDRLSGGQKQRVALARALAPAPKVLLLDEPLTALDAKLRESLRGELAELLQQLQITTVLVTHDQAEAMSLGARVAVMSRGRLEQIASPQELYDAPGSAFVAEFVGSINRVRARVVDGRMELGGDATLHYRPHEVHLVEANDANPSGRVVARFFLGGATRYVVELTDGQRLTVDAFGRSSASIGDSFGVRFGQITEVGAASNAHLSD